MKSFLLVVVLLAGGGYYYFHGGKEMIDQHLNPGSLPETIEVEPATFIGNTQGNPYSK